MKDTKFNAHERYPLLLYSLLLSHFFLSTSSCRFLFLPPTPPSPLILSSPLPAVTCPSLLSAMFLNPHRLGLAAQLTMKQCPNASLRRLVLLSPQSIRRVFSATVLQYHSHYTVEPVYSGHP